MAHVPGPYGPVQIIPAGLLALLQLKNQGQNPSQLHDSYQCVLEMRDWFFATQAFQSGSVTVNLLGDDVFIVLATLCEPTAWRAYNEISAQFTLPATETSMTACLAWIPGTNSAQTMILSDYVTLAAGQTRMMRMNRDLFWAPPGSILLAHVAEYTGPNNGTVRVERRYSLLPP